MGRALRALTFCVVGGLAVVVGTNVKVRASVAHRAFRVAAAVPARPVAIVPGSPTSLGKAKATLEGRLRGALALYRGGQVQAILVSGIEVARDPETSAMRAWLEERGVPAGDIADDDRGTRTRETMHRAADTFGVERAIVCTEALAMPRALFLARASGIDAVGLEVPSPLDHLPKWVAVEALKTTLAFVEETFSRPASAPASDTERVALR
jgi:vancomycin permeability regulator SanA